MSRKAAKSPRSVPLTKVCRRCLAEKAADAFPPNQRMRDGLSSWCRACATARTRQWKAEHRDEILARRRAWYAEHGDAERARNAMRYYRDRAAKQARATARMAEIAKGLGKRLAPSQSSYPGPAARTHTTAAQGVAKSGRPSKSRNPGQPR